MDFRRIFSLFIIFLIVSITPITAHELSIPYSSVKSTDSLDNQINSLVVSGFIDDHNTSTNSRDSLETSTSKNTDLKSEVKSTDLKSEVKSTYLENEIENTDLNKNEFKGTVEYFTSEKTPRTPPDDTNSTNQTTTKPSNSSQTAKTASSSQTISSTQTTPSNGQTTPSNAQSNQSTTQTTQPASQTNTNSNSTNTNTIQTANDSRTNTTGLATNKTAVGGTDNQTSNNARSEFNVDDSNLEKANKIAERLKNDYGINVEVKVVTVDDLVAGRGDINDYDIVQMEMDGLLVYVIYLGYDKKSNKVYLESLGTLNKDYMPLEEFLCDYTGVKITLNDTLTSRESVLYCINEITALSPAAKKAVKVLNTISTVFEVIGGGFAGLATITVGLGFICQGIAGLAQDVVIKAAAITLGNIFFLAGGVCMLATTVCEGIGFGLDYLASKIPDWF